MSGSIFTFNGYELNKFDNLQDNRVYSHTSSCDFSEKNSSFLATRDHNLYKTDVIQYKIELSSRSQKTCLKPFESSFQCGFLSQHIQACKLKLQNFIESVSSCSEKIQKQTLRMKLIFQKEESRYSCNSIIDSIHSDINLSEKQQFKTDLKYQKKLSEFLDEICHIFVPEVSGQLVAVANFIWNQYLKVIDSRFFQQELKQWAQNLVQTKFKDYSKLLKNTKKRCFEEDENQTFPNFDQSIKEFMKCFFVTVALVIEQYFQNPYYNDCNQVLNSYKRLSSEEDFYSQDQFSQLQEDICGSKKLKFF